MQQLTFLDLCSGIGGFRLGLESAGHRCIGYCEYDRFARASYEAMYDTEGEWKADDVTKLKSEDVPYADIWCFGFPCQDISVAGKQRGLVGERRFIDTTSYTGLFCLLKLFPHIINSLWGICSSQVVHQFKWHAGTPYQFPAYGAVFSSTVRHYQRKPIMLQGHLAGSADTFYCCFF